MTKRRVFLDGNGSSQINVEGLGVYVPASELTETKQKLGNEIQRLKDQVNAMQVDRKALNLRTVVRQGSKHTYSEDNFIFQYDTAEDLAELMFKHLLRARNPYDPVNTEYDDFNQKICDLRLSSGNELESLRDAIQACETKAIE